MTRYRIVTRTTTAGGTETHTSSVILTHAEALDGMAIDEQLARLTGWRTLRLATADGPILHCDRGRTVRTLTIRESTPFYDTL